MANRVHFSSLQLSLEQVAAHHGLMQAALFDFFAGNSSAILDTYADFKIEEVRGALLAELGSTSALSVLSSVEATIRIDYLRRVYGRWRDPLSRAMKALHRKKANNVRLEDDLIRL